MKYRTLTAIVAMIALYTTLPAFSQATAPAQGGATGAGIGSQPQQQRIDLDFRGGTVVEYINQIRRLMPQANFVVMPGADEFQMPPMQLRNITVHQLAMLIRETASPPERGGRVLVNDLGQVFAVQVQLNPAARAKQQPTEPMVISLSDVIVGDVQAEDVLTSIETALSLFGEEYPEAQIRYHDATKLLIARGHSHQMMHIMTVVEELRKPVDMRSLGQMREANLTLERIVKEQEDVISRLRQRLIEVELELRSRN